MKSSIPAGQSKGKSQEKYNELCHFGDSLSNFAVQ
jgi:hypothetical protein